MASFASCRRHGPCARCLRRRRLCHAKCNTRKRVPVPIPPGVLGDGPLHDFEVRAVFEADGPPEFLAVFVGVEEEDVAFLNARGLELPQAQIHQFLADALVAMGTKTGTGTKRGRSLMPST